MSSPGEAWSSAMQPADGLEFRLRGIPAFTRLDDEVIADVAAASQLRPVAAGETLVEAGDPADELYLVLDGRFEVLPGQQEREAAASRSEAYAHLGPGSIVGEIAVLSGATRSATLRAVTDAEVAVVEGTRFLDLLDAQPMLGVELARTASHRLLETRLRQHLGELFPGLDSTAIGEAMSRVAFVALAPGQVLFSAGDPAEDAYVVVSGRVRVLRYEQDGTVSQPIPEVGAGELVGERALLEDEWRSASVVAARRTQLARFPRSSFESLMLEYPRAMLSVTRRLVQRQRDARTDFGRSLNARSSVALVPVHPDLDVRGLAATLEAEAGSHSSVCHLDAAQANAGAGVSGATQADGDGHRVLRMERYLDDVEASTDLVLLIADHEATAWSRRCVERADHLVLIADATRDPAITPQEQRLAPTRELPHQRVTLLLVHPPGTERPRGTAAWLDGRDLDDHVHMRQGHRPDIARFARMLSGRSVWLTLGGGGAKGFAHLGLVRAMREVGLPIDGLAVASVGAPLGALVAMETPTDELLPLTEELFHRLLDYTLPVSGLIAGRRIARSIERGTDGRDLEDLWIPYRCVSTNLTRSTTVVHRRGVLARAMHASLAIPGVLPAVAYGGDLHVDGGVMNNLPVDVARRETPTGTVIASDVAPPLGPRAHGDHGLYVQGGRVLLRRYTPGLKAAWVPRLMPTLMRSLLVAAAH
ncbi:MAG: cyclic nucleotide-binding domain-containing protein, partial [Trueperaceae bacterium]